MKKRYIYTSEKELDGLRWTARVIDFGVSLTVFSSLNELTTAYVMLRERKDLFQHKVKMLANETMKCASMLRTRIMTLMSNGEFFDTYSDRVIDLAEDDITKFRISIKQTLDDAHFKESELVSYIETARTMLEMACEHFDSVMRAAREDYGVNYSQAFYEFNTRPLLQKWEAMCKILYMSDNDIDLNNDRNTTFFEKIATKFADGDYVGECKEAAFECCPEFTSNEVVVIGAKE